MDKNAVWNVLKWVLAALAAGFVGQFGRVLAMRIIERRRLRRDSSEGDGSLKADLELEKVRLDNRAKVEKKMAKQAVKREKKNRG